MAFKGSLVSKAADQTLANYTTLTAIAFTSEVYDTDGWHDNVTNNTRFTVPSGVTRVRIFGQASIQLLSVNLWSLLVIHKNGAALSPSVIQQHYHTSANFRIQLVSPVLECSPGDYFELKLQIETDTSVTIQAALTFFGIEAVEFPQPAFAGAMVRPTSDSGATDFTVATVVGSLTTQVYEIGGNWHDTVTNPERVSVPTGVSRVRLLAQAGLQNLLSGDFKLLSIRKNGTTAVAAHTSTDDVNTTTYMQCASPVLEVTGGSDYFEMQLTVATDTSSIILAGNTFLAIERVS